MKFAEMSLILQHGWGLDSRMWSGWSDKLQHILPGSTVCASERGYFGLPFEAATRASNSNKGSLLVICHSLGLHLVSPALLQKCDGLVLIGSFRNFHGGSDREQKLSRTKVRRMSAKIQIDPALVLQDFYRSAGFDWSAGFQPASDPTTHDHDLNTNLLHDDLQLLDQCDLDIRLLQQIPKIQILHGAQDMIVPLERAHDLQRSLTNSSLSVLESAQHSLPSTHTDWCVEQVLRNFAPAMAGVSTCR